MKLLPAIYLLVAGWQDCVAVHGLLLHASDLYLLPPVQADVEASVYHTGRLVSTGALDVMTTQRDVVYTARAETRAKIHKRAKVSGGVTVARLVEEGGPPTKASCSPLQ